MARALPILESRMIGADAALINPCGGSARAPVRTQTCQAAFAQKPGNDPPTGQLDVPNTTQSDDIANIPAAYPDGIFCFPQCGYGGFSLRLPTDCSRRNGRDNACLHLYGLRHAIPAE
jgi:hypothetical protein